MIRDYFSINVNTKKRNMKHIRNFENFKNNRNTLHDTQENFYYNKGKACGKSIFEMELIGEGYSEQAISTINVRRIDTRIIDGLYEYLSTGKQNGIDLLTEEIAGIKLPGIKDMYSKVSGIVDKGIAIGKSAIGSFGDFLKNIGNIVKNLFEKIKAFFKKVWELFKPNVVTACGVISKTVGGGSPEKMKKVVDTISGEKGQSEFNALYEDLSGIGAKFASGNIGNMSPDAEQHLKDEAGEYKGVEGDVEIEKLMQESIERKGTVRKIFYSIKGFISEGGTIEEMEKMFEAGEADKAVLKEGDEVTYTSKEGNKITKKIVRIEGDNAVFTDKEGKEFTKKVSDLKKTEGLGKKMVHGFVGEEPEKKGVFGWLVEAVGFVFSPLAKMKEYAIKGGTNGILTMISAMKRGAKNAFKFVLMGVVAGLVYHIVHGMMSLTGAGHEEKPVAKETEDKETEDKEGQPAENELSEEEKIAANAIKSAGSAPTTKAPIADTIAAPKMKFKLNKESLEFLLEGAVLDINKPSKYTSFFKDMGSSAVPVAGSLVVAAISNFFPLVHTILEVILVGIGIFELVGTMCKLDWVAKKGLKVCKVRHDIHHFLEGSISGKKFKV